MIEQSEPIRYTVRGARACTAHTTAGTPCQAPAIRGGFVCQAHGGSSSKVKAKARLRLAALADPAIEALASIMQTADSDSDRLAAANSILDRAGYGRSQQITTEDAHEMLIERLLEVREAASHELPLAAP